MLLGKAVDGADEVIWFRDAGHGRMRAGIRGGHHEGHLSWTKSAMPTEPPATAGGLLVGSARSR